MKLAESRGLTLKHVVLTWQGDDLGAQPTREGAERRRLDIQHLAQTLRRKGKLFEYLRVSETHKSGKIHVHLLVIMPYVDQAFLSDVWKRHARGAFRVFIQAVGVRCPYCWPGRNASQKAKRRSMIIPPPGKGRCTNCGYAPDWSLESKWDEVAYAASLEAGKYLSKSEDTSTVVKRLSRTRLWAAECQLKDDRPVAGLCEVCGDEHQVTFVGSEEVLVQNGYGGLLDVRGGSRVVWQAAGGDPCLCWSKHAWQKVVWRESGGTAETGLLDLLEQQKDYG
jgi:hypothetical protein